MYRVQVYDITGAGVPVVLFKAIVRSWSKKISAPGQMLFSLPMSDTDATADNLQEMKRVKLLRLRDDGTQYDAVWSGYIESAKENLNMIDVLCLGTLNLFTKRFTTDSQAFTGQGSTEAFGLLSAANTDNDTGITSGTDGVTTANAVTAQGRIDLLTAWEKLAAADGAEFEIDDDGHFNFVPTLGSDLSSSITLRYRRDGTPGNNVQLTGFGADAAPMANRIIGTTSAGSLTSTKDDPVSQAKYGLLVEVKQFNEAQDQAALDAMTQAYLTQRANPATDYVIIPLPPRKSFDIVTGDRVLSGIQYADIGLGDLVTCDIQTENQSIFEARRIAAIDVTVDEQGSEQISYTISQSGVFITSAYLQQDQVGKIKRDIRDIQNLLI